MNSSIDIRQLRKPSGGPPQNVEPATEQPSKGIWAFLNKDIRLFGNALPDKVKEGFYLELGTLLEAGVDIRTALELIVEEQPKKKLKNIFSEVSGQIVNGATLSAALRKHSCFTPYEYFSVQIGEETGKLVIVLKELAVFYQKKIKQSRQIVGALTYPVIVLIVAFGAVAFMMVYVVPMFSDVLKRFGGDLPLVTRMVLSVSSFVRRSAGMILLVLVLIAAGVVSQRKKQKFRDLSSRLILRVPVVGGIVRKIYLSRLANTLSLLIESKIPIIQAIQLVRKMVRFYPIEHSLDEAEAHILAGEPLHRALVRYPVYPAKMISLIKVGEEVNQLGLFFNKISEQYSGEVEHQTSVLSKFIEPLIIVVLGLIVGVILVAMYLPLFKLGQNF